MGVLDLIFPKACFGCKRGGVYLCKDCLRKEEIVDQIHLRNTPYLDGLACPFKYRGAVRKAILALKYKFASDIAKELGVHAANAIKSGKFFKGKNIVIPIPAYRTRENWRGFNQAEEIGRHMAKALGWEFSKEALIKIKPTPAQTGLSGTERLENLKGSFAVNSRLSVSPLPKIILFDDVWTTGSTLNEAAKSLKEQGTKVVWGIAFARGWR